jgi:hypothetical protein
MLAAVPADGQEPRAGAGGYRPYAALVLDEVGRP